MSQPGTNKPPKRTRLVAYSDSESEAEADDDVPEPEPGTGHGTRPQPPPPETENELAQIVIRLQEKYIREYENLETRQDDMARQLEDWKGAIEDRLRMELKILEALVKASRQLLLPEKVFNVDLNAVSREDLPRITMCELPVREPPSSSPTPSLAVLGQVSTAQPAAPAVVSSPAPEQAVLAGHSTWINEGHSRPAASAPLPPKKIRSTEKKATRPKPAEPNQRFHQAKPKTPTATEEPPVPVESAVKKAKRRAEGNSGIPETTATHQTTLDPSNRAANGPASPYDNPKYFSPLTVRDKDGIERPIFKFYPHPETVQEQWAEYRYGLHNQPAVEQLEAKYRAKWRSSAYARSWFTRRKTFWEKIKDMLVEGKTESEALSAMEERAEGSVPKLIGLLCKERTEKSTGKSTEPQRKRKRDLEARRKQMANDISEGEDFIVSDSASDGDSQKSYKPRTVKGSPRRRPSEQPPKSGSHAVGASPYALLRKRIRLAEAEAGNVDG